MTEHEEYIARLFLFVGLLLGMGLGACIVVIVVLA